MAETTVENLEFHIKRSGMSSEGAAVLKSYAEALGELQKNKKGGQIPQKMIDSISSLAGAMKAVDSKAVSMLRQFASALKTFDGLKGVTVNKDFAQRVADIAAAADLLDDKHITRLYRFGSALKNMQGAKTNIGDKLPEQMKKLAEAVDTITDATVSRLEHLTEALSKLRGIDLRGLGSVMSEQRKAQAAAQQAQQRQNNQKPAGGQTTQQPAGNGGREAIQWTWSLKKNADLAKNAFAQMASSVLKIHPAVKLVASVLGGIVKSVLKIAAGIAKWSFKTVLGLVKRVAAGIKSIAQGVINVGKNLVKNWYEHSVFKSLEESIKQVQKLIHSVGRVALYRAIRSAIKYVTDELKEGTENAYWFSREFGNATHYISEAYDNLSSKNFKMSNQLGAAWSTLIATIEPILIRLINLVTKAAEAFTQFFAILGGSSTYLKAVDYNKQWAESADEAADAAREWKNQLMDFDTLNRLNDNDNSSRGKGSTLPDYENMFEEVPVSSWFEKLKDMLKSGKWGEIGEMLGDKFNELVNKFDWDGWGTKIGQKIQGAIDMAYKFLKRADFRNLGEKIMDFIDHCADEIDFEELGRLSTRIRTALYDVLYGAFTNPGSMAKLAKNLSDYVLGALDELTDWLRTLDPVQVANAIRDFFGNIKGEEIRDSFVTLVSTAWEKAIALKNELFPDGLLPTVTDAITKWFKKLDWVQISGTIREKLSSIWSVISETFDQIWPQTERDKFKEQVKTRLTEVLKEAMQLAAGAAFEMLPRRLKILFAGEGEDTGAGFVANLEKGVSSKKGDMEAALDDSVARPVSSVIGDFLAKIFHARTAYALEADQLNEISDGVKDTTITDFDTMGKDVPKSVDGMQAKLAKATSLVSAGFEKMRSLSVKAGEAMRDKVGDAWTGISAATESMTTALQQKVSTAWASIQQNTLSMWEGLRASLQNIWTGISAAASTIWNTIQLNAVNAWNSIATVAATAWGSISTAAGTAWASISAAASSAWGGMITAASSAAGSLTSIASGMAQSIGDAVSSIRSFLGDAVDYAWEAGRNLGSALDSALDTAGEIARNVTNAAREVYSSAKTTATTAARNVTTTVSSAVNSAMNKIKKGISNISKFGFANGGFPEDGLFFANHGEMVGQFSNGRTAVANNEQITEGIYRAAYQAFTDAFTQTGGSGGDREIAIYMDGNEIAKTTTKYQRQFARAAG